MGIVDREAGAWDEKARPVLNVEEINPRPAWRIRHTLNQQNATLGPPPPKKDVKNDERSRNVYENTRNNDKLSWQMSDIRVQLRPFLQKIAVFKGHFVVKDALGTGLRSEFTARFAVLAREEPRTSKTEVRATPVFS